MFPFLGTIVKGISNALALSNLNVSDWDITPAVVYAGAQLHADGNLKRKQGTGASYTKVGTNQWIHDEFKVAPGFDPADYEGGLFSWTGSSLSPGSSALSTYISLDLSPLWYYEIGFGIRSGNGQLRVREKANPSNEVTCTLTLYAEVDTGE